jgi:acetyl esterase/lipase
MKFAWQLDESLRVSRMMLMIVAANERRGRTMEKKLKYGAHPQQFLVLHYPCGPVHQQKPLLFFLHGGGWGHGNPAVFRFIGRFFAEAGYPVILGGYRLAPLHKFPDQLEDAYAGLKAGLQLAASHGLRTDSVILAGQSAGAQLASLMLLDRWNLQAHGFTQESFAGLLLVSGVLNFDHCRTLKDRIMLQNFLGSPANWSRADPIRFIRGDETVPVLCIHGERDMLIDNVNSTSFIDRLNGTGEIYLAPRAYHTDLTSMFLENIPATEIMLGWLRRLEASEAVRKAPHSKAY